MEWYLKVLKNYVGFDGRARRKEYWMYTLINFIVLVIAAVLDNVLGLRFNEQGFIGPIYALYALAVFLPGLAVTIRRLHDTDRSGWWFLIAFIPLVGIVLLVFMCLDGTHGDNRFGPDPKSGEGMAATVA